MKRLTRRTLIAGATLVPVAAIRTAAQPSPHMPLLEAAVARLIPADDLGPGAKEAGAANYIAAVVANDAAFSEGLAAIDAESRAQFTKPFIELGPDDQDAVLTTIETKSRPFFARLRQLTLEGTFGDPSYGGNRNFIGWDLIRYPGPRLAAGPDEQKLRDSIKPVRRQAGHGH
jgi:hypothetical protein